MFTAASDAVTYGIIMPNKIGIEATRKSRKMVQTLCGWNEWSCEVRTRSCAMKSGCVIDLVPRRSSQHFLRSSVWLAFVSWRLEHNTYSSRV